MGKPAARVASELVAKQAEAVSAPWNHERTLIAVNKCDLATPPAELGGEFLVVSATTGAGVPQLIDAMAQRLVPQVPPADTAVPFTDRQVDLLRELFNRCQATDVASAVDSLQQLLSGDC